MSWFDKFPGARKKTAPESKEISQGFQKKLEDLSSSYEKMENVLDKLVAHPQYAKLLSERAGVPQTQIIYEEYERLVGPTTELIHKIEDGLSKEELAKLVSKLATFYEEGPAFIDETLTRLGVNKSQLVEYEATIQKYHPLLIEFWEKFEVFTGSVNEVITEHSANGS